ncbi:MAG TPA: NAD-dependent epimerase/dehydratase family protein [Patescibacteria group bacterium]|nr:NAD-dependent epimerase/dehydratase family protein [Patescibacteria group bacterium]
MSNILITGVAGFVGINLTKYLIDKGHDITGIDLFDRHGRLLNAELLKQGKFTFKKIDLAQDKIPYDEFKDIDVIFHLAALPHVDYSYFYPHRAITNNIESLLSMTELALKLEIPLILASSVEVYGGSEDKIYTEDSLPLPLSPYAASKVASEAIIKTFVETQKLTATIFRFTNLYGPWQAPDRLLPRVISQVFSDIEIVVEKGTNRDFVFIDDACEVLEKAINFSHTGEIYNLSTGIKRNNYEIVQKVLEQLPTSNIQIMEPRHHDGRGKYLVSSSQKLSKATGWSAKTPINEGITDTIQWYRDHPTWVAQFHKNISVGRQTDKFLTDSNLNLPYWK